MATTKKAGNELKSLDQLSSAMYSDRAFGGKSQTSQTFEDRHQVPDCSVLDAAELSGTKEFKYLIASRLFPRVSWLPHDKLPPSDRRQHRNHESSNVDFECSDGTI